MWIKRNRILSGTFGNRYDAFLQLAIEQTPNHAVAHFRKSGLNCAGRDDDIEESEDDDFVLYEDAVDNEEE
jgi:hypothetical protein